MPAGVAPAGAGATAAGGPPEEEHLQPHLNFWQLPWVQNLLPLGTSLAVHLGIILVGVLLLKTVTEVVETVQKQQIIIPDATMVDGAEPGGIPNPGLGTDANRRAEQQIDPTVTQSEGVAEKRSENLTQSLSASGSITPDGDNLIGGGAAAGPVGLRGAAGTGMSGGDGGGPLAPFGTPGGGQGLGPRAPFMGQGGNATRVVYLCDGTGTMVGLRYQLVKGELKKAIDVLKPIQQFAVIFFQDENFEAVDKKTLIPATGQNKRKAYDFLEAMSIRGQTNPLPAIEAAFAMKPQLIYLLSDGEFDNLVSYDQVLARIAELNKDKSVRINTILFGDRDKRAEETLRRMAQENGGRFNYVSEKDLDR
jgi:hypothetical protein